jgi:hypothetical protein
MLLNRFLSNHLNHFKYKIKLQEIVIDTIKLITIDGIRDIVKINEQYKKNNNLIILENKQLKNKILNKKRKFRFPITLKVIKYLVICSNDYTYKRNTIE